MARLEVPVTTTQDTTASIARHFSMLTVGRPLFGGFSFGVWRRSSAGLRPSSLAQVDDAANPGHLQEFARCLMRDLRSLDVTGSGEFCGVLVERRDQRAPRKGMKGF